MTFLPRLCEVSLIIPSINRPQHDFARSQISLATGFDLFKHLRAGPQAVVLGVGRNACESPGPTGPNSLESSIYQFGEVWVR